MDKKVRGPGLGRRALSCGCSSRQMTIGDTSRVAKRIPSEEVY